MAQQRPMTRHRSAMIRATARTTQCVVREAEVGVTIQFLYRDRRGRRHGSVRTQHSHNTTPSARCMI